MSVQMRTMLDVADNSGARRLACIKVQGGSTGDYGRIGDVITCSVRESNPDAPDTVTVSCRSDRSAHSPGNLFLSQKIWASSDGARCFSMGVTVT